MNAQDFIDAGFRVSAQVDPSQLSRAVADVEDAYVRKVAPEYNAEHPSDDERACVMQLAFILLCRRAAVATRSGGKVKTAPTLSESGVQASQTDVDNADRLLRKVQTVSGLPSKLVDDIAAVYFRNVYLSL